MPATLDAAPPSTLQLNSPDLQRRINALRTIDNVTNWFYLAREYLFLGLTIGLTIAFYQNWADWGLGWAWNLPVTLLAITLIGAMQHRLTTLGHEASHYMLFQHRKLNELVSDWLCLFPMLSTTHHYRLQHLAHHQYVNDPERDPDISQMSESGHRFQFPMEPGRFVWQCVIKQFLWFPNLIKYIRIRARYNSTGGGSGPYEAKGPKSMLLIAVAIVYLLTLVATLTGLTMLGDPWLLAIIPPAMLAAVLTYYALAPERLFRQSLIKPDISLRWTTFGRVTYLTALFTGLAWMTLWTGQPWGLYYLLLWIVPIGTSFSFCMILRQVVQHGNASQDRLTNTRIFHVGRLIQLAVFPLGMDYHLPHHMYPMVPHFRLRQLHNLLLETQAYRREATVVEGYFFHREQPPEHPTVLDLMARD